MATAKKSTKSKKKTMPIKASKPAVKKKASKPVVKKKAGKSAVKKKAGKPAVKKKASKPAVKKKESKPVAKKRPATKKKTSTKAVANAVSKTLRATIADLKKEIQALKNEAKIAGKKADAMASLVVKRGQAVSSYLSNWDKKAHSAVSKMNKKLQKKKK